MTDTLDKAADKIAAIGIAVEERAVGMLERACELVVRPAVVREIKARLGGTGLLMRSWRVERQGANTVAVVSRAPHAGVHGRTSSTTIRPVHKKWLTLPAALEAKNRLAADFGKLTFRRTGEGAGLFRGNEAIFNLRKQVTIRGSGYLPAAVAVVERDMPDFIERELSEAAQKAAQ